VNGGGCFSHSSFLGIQGNDSGGFVERHQMRYMKRKEISGNLFS
jgi:hypothetical protein